MEQLVEREYKYEILNGKIYYYAPSGTPNHNKTIGNLYSRIHNYLKGKVCEVYGDEMDVYLEEGINYLQPDVKVICNPEILKKIREGSNAIYGVPDFVVEVLSKSSYLRDTKTKKEIYEKYGVKEYWIINYNFRSVEVYHLENGKYNFPQKIYVLLNEEEMKDAKQDEITEQEIKVSIFDDLTISLKDIFDKIW